MAQKDFFASKAKIKTYNKDGRLPVEKVYLAFLELKHNFGWLVEEVYHQVVPLPNNPQFTLPILSLRTSHKGRAIWLISGIHGEEPAGPNAIVKNIDFLGTLGRDIPFVLLGLCNPSGYVKNWRYPDGKGLGEGNSVGDSEHLLPDLDSKSRPRRDQPACPEAAALTDYILKLIPHYRPVFSLDLHEDKILQRIGKHSYVYSQGETGAKDLIAQKIVKILGKSGLPTLNKGKTKFGEEIVSGVVSDVHDGSIDELLASKIILKSQSIKGPGVAIVIVVETPVIGVPLSKRVEVHSKIIRLLKQFYLHSRSPFSTSFRSSRMAPVCDGGVKRTRKKQGGK